METSDLTKLRVMVAAGHEDMLEALVCIIKDAFEVVAAVSNGRDLVDLALSVHPDVIVSDIMLPVLTGPQAMHQLSARGQNIPFVLVGSGPPFTGPCTWSFVTKMDAVIELVPAVHAVASKKRISRRKPPSAKQPRQ